MKLDQNMPALRAHNNLSKADFSVAKSTNRLSSGKKINSSRDGAASLAITNKLRMQLRGLEQANKNSSNGMSIAQTAEGALNEIHAMLQRIRELGVYSANDTNAPTDKQKMQDEIDQLLNEISSISDKTEFNKIKLLSGACDRIYRVDSAKVDSVLSTDEKFQFGDLTLNKTNQGIEAGFTFTGGSTVVFPDPAYTGKTISINGIEATIESTDTNATLRTKLRNAATQAGLTSTPGVGLDLLATIKETTVGPREIEIGGTANLTALGFTKAAAPPPVVGTENAFTVTSPLGYTVKSIGEEVTITENATNAEMTLKTNPAFAIGATMIQNRKGPIVIHTGPNTDMSLAMHIPRVDAETLKLAGVNVLSAKAATNALHSMDYAIGFVSAVRSKLGAFVNRFEHTVNSLDMSETSTAASISSIEDTDMAAEMTEYSKNNIIYQAAMSIIAQANARPQQVLQILQQ